VIWFDVDGAREYLAQGGAKKPSRKTVYNLVNAGLKVARVGASGRRLMFCAEWIDAFLTQAAERLGES
jgi:hypothetical protein